MPEEASQRPIVVGQDGSSQAEDALELGRLLARATSARLIAAEVSVDRLGILRRHGSGASAAAASESRGAKPRTVVSTSPAHGLRDLAEETGADMIVVGSTHRGPVGRVFPGTVADDLVHGAPCAVAIAPKGYARRYANRLSQLVVVGFDGSPGAHLAADAALRIAKSTGASLRLIAVLEPLPLTALDAGAAGQAQVIMADEKARLEGELAALVDRLPAGVEADARVVRGDAAHKLLQETSGPAADMLVVGSRGYGPVDRALLGSVSAEIIRDASCPVMVVPRRSS